MTYSVEDSTKKYLLRIHNETDGLDFSFYQGGSRETLIYSEIYLLEKLLINSNIIVQSPILNKTGDYVSRLKNGDLVTVLSWLDGETLSCLELTDELVYKVGQMIATLHKFSNELPHLSRVCYGDGFIDKFIAETKVANKQEHIGTTACVKMEKILLQLKKVLSIEKNDFTIVHADLSKSNLIYTKDAISPIDFSMYGYCIPEIDLGDLVFNIGDSQLLASLLDGYESVGGHKINEEYLSICKAFSAISYIIIHH